MYTLAVPWRQSTAQSKWAAVFFWEEFNLRFCFHLCAYDAPLVIRVKPAEPCPTDMMLTRAISDRIILSSQVDKLKIPSTFLHFDTSMVLPFMALLYASMLNGLVGYRNVILVRRTVFSLQLCLELLTSPCVMRFYCFTWKNLVCQLKEERKKM